MAVHLLLTCLLSDYLRVILSMITVKRANHDEMYDIQKNKTSQKVFFMSCF